MHSSSSVCTANPERQPPLRRQNRKKRSTSLALLLLAVVATSAHSRTTRADGRERSAPHASRVRPYRDAVEPGQPTPLGAHWKQGEGVNFAVWSRHGTAAQLCLVSPHGDEHRVPMHKTGDVFHVKVPGAKPGQAYGLRVDGPRKPEEGHCFDPSEPMLVDPYTRDIIGQPPWVQPNFQPLLGRVIDPSFEWGDDRRPNTPLADTVIYELHPGGWSMNRPDFPSNLRGKFGGVARDPDYFLRLGATAVELMPVQYFIDDARLVAAGLRNYWGYNTLGFFAPERRYARRDPVREFKQMVKALHRAGLEVILDVVYNHTAEGDDAQPALSLKGFGKGDYYRLQRDDPRRYEDFSGCGNTINTNSEVACALILDSLAYWFQEMHVDGFRFDLLTALMRDADGNLNPNHPLSIAIQNDPRLLGAKLIGEAWDAAGGYLVGGLPRGYAEWNGRYRDGVRRFWRGDDHTTREMALRLAGSPDLYGKSGRGPKESVNFITAHDGFTLWDLVSYNDKHNAPNGEEGRDGDNNNHSWNNGIEGPTDDPGVLASRRQQERNFWATLMLGRGLPMIQSGMEHGNSQGGDNNTYNQDNPLGWIDWDLSADRRHLLVWAQLLGALRKGHPVWRQPRHPQADEARWLNASGEIVGDPNQVDPASPTLGVWWSGKPTTPDESGAAGRPADDTFLHLMNRGADAANVQLPACEPGHCWAVVFDTTTLQPALARALRDPVRWSQPLAPQAADLGALSRHAGGQTLPLAGRSQALLVQLPELPATSER